MLAVQSSPSFTRHSVTPRCRPVICSSPWVWLSPGCLWASGGREEVCADWSTGGHGWVQEKEQPPTVVHGAVIPLPGFRASPAWRWGFTGELPFSAPAYLPLAWTCWVGAPCTAMTRTYPLLKGPCKPVCLRIPNYHLFNQSIIRYFAFQLFDITNNTMMTILIHKSLCIILNI